MSSRFFTNTSFKSSVHIHKKKTLFLKTAKWWCTFVLSLSTHTYIHRMWKWNWVQFLISKHFCTVGERNKEEDDTRNETKRHVALGERKSVVQCNIKSCRSPKAVTIAPKPLPTCASKCVSICMSTHIHTFLWEHLHWILLEDSFCLKHFLTEHFFHIYLQVNLDPQLRADILQTLSSPRKTTFDEAQRRIQSLLESDSYLRFLTSDIYTSLLNSEQERKKDEAEEAAELEAESDARTPTPTPTPSTSHPVSRLGGGSRGTKQSKSSSSNLASSPFLEDDCWRQLLFEDALHCTAFYIFFCETRLWYYSFIHLPSQPIPISFLSVNTFL